MLYLPFVVSALLPVREWFGLRFWQVSVLAVGSFAVLVAFVLPKTLAAGLALLFVVTAVLVHVRALFWPVAA